MRRGHLKPPADEEYGWSQNEHRKKAELEKQNCYSDSDNIPKEGEEWKGQVTETSPTYTRYHAGAVIFMEVRGRRRVHPSVSKTNLCKRICMAQRHL